MAIVPKNPRFAPKPAGLDPTRIVEILVFPSVQLLDVAGPLQVFASANEHMTGLGRPAPYAMRTVAVEAGAIESSAGLGLAAAPLTNIASPLDTLIVAGGPGVMAATADGALIDWLATRAASARRVASVCTGAFLLGACGLLDGRRVTTHWSFCAELAERHPTALVEPDPIFLNDGPIWTSAGVTAGIDLALALVEQDLGRSVSMAVARYLVVFLKRPGGQAQFSAALSLQTADERFGELHEWMRARLAGDLSLSALALKAGMSERSFSRHYLDATGTTPARAVEHLRVDAARRLLSETRQPVNRIARRCGFGSEETMRRSFLRLLAVAPQNYRSRFGV